MANKQVSKYKVAVILPVSDSMPHLPAMIDSLYGSTDFPFKVIIVESESTDGTAEYVDNLCNDKDNIEVFHTKKEGLTKAINMGIHKSGDMDVYITQDDVIHFRLYKRDWLAEMYSEAQKEHIGLITPLNGGGVSGSDYIKGFQWVGTWACYISKKAIKRVGVFDTNMSPGDDIDYTFRVMLSGLNAVVIDYWIQHHRLTEHGDSDAEDKKKKMGEYFRNKYNIGGKNE